MKDEIVQILQKRIMGKAESLWKYLLKAGWYVDIEHVNDTPGTVDRMRMKNGENERLKKADGRRIFERRREKEEKAENFKKDEKSFEKGVAFF